MISELVLRFLIGGVVVTAFSVLGDLFRPKSFGGIFAAAPSVALATLGLAVAKHGGDYGALEGRSMILGAIALCVYAQLSSWLLLHFRFHALAVTVASLIVWGGVAFGLWALWLR